MLLKVLKSNIHCASMTAAQTGYAGSITADTDLMEAKNFQATIALADQRNRLKQKLQPSMETNAADHN